MLLNFNFQIDATNAAHVSALNVFLKTVGGVQTLETNPVEKVVNEVPAKAKKQVPAEKPIEPVKDLTDAEVREDATQKAAVAFVEAAAAEANAVEYTLAQVQSALQEKMPEHKETCRAKLYELGGKSVSTLDPSKYGEFMDFLSSL